MPRRCSTRIHHSHVRLDRVRLEPTQKRRGNKPNGFWYEMTEGDWASFLAPAGRGGLQGAGDFAYGVTLKKSARIAQPSSATKVRKFTERYGVAVDIGDGDFVVMIDWASVAEDFDGIEFCPHIHKIRFEEGLDWYSTVDVDSGCVWNADAVAKIVRLR